MKMKIFLLAFLTIAFGFNVVTVRAEDEKDKENPAKHENPEKNVKVKHKARHKSEVGRLVGLKHDGKTIYVSEHAVKDHLEHGDTVAVTHDGKTIFVNEADEKVHLAHGDVLVPKPTSPKESKKVEDKPAEQPEKDNKPK